MRLLVLMALFVLLGAILWSPESRAVPSLRSLTLILVCVLLLCACGGCVDEC